MSELLHMIVDQLVGWYGVEDTVNAVLTHERIGRELHEGKEYDIVAEWPAERGWTYKSTLRIGVVARGPLRGYSPNQRPVG